jgi:hypothetical protein
MGMKLATDWIPKRGTNALELARSLQFYCQAAVEGREPGNDIKPTTVFANLNWLMPLEDAEKNLKGMLPEMGGSKVMAHLCFPQRSLFMRHYTGRFTDPHLGGIFKELRIVTDLNRNIVAVQMSNNHPRPDEVTWPNAVAQGHREPYYDFLATKEESTAGHSVRYALYRRSKAQPKFPDGVTCIQTAYVTHGPRQVMGQKTTEVENVRWYLPSPLARKILESTTVYLSGSVLPR